MRLRQVIYRHFDAEDNLLYVGQSLRPMVRLETHRSASDWYYDIAKVTLDWLEPGVSASEVEQAAIRSEMPKYNSPLRQKGRPLDPSAEEIVLNPNHPGALLAHEPPLDLED